MYHTLPIDIAFISQKITPIDLAETDNHITELDDILIDSELFKQIFYPHGENFGIDTTILSNPNVLNYISFMSPHRTLNGGSKPFSLLELIISNIETDLNVNRNCFKTATLIELSKELSNIKTLCDIHSRCIECSLPWSNVLSIIKDNYITLKLTHIRHTPIKRFGKNIDINEKIKEFYNEIKKYKIEDIICIDETCINSLEKRKHCYSDKGKRCTIKTDNQEVFKKYTGIFAINYEKTIGWELYDKGGIDTERLYAFLEKYITNNYKNKLIILDNASCHRNEKIKELINRNNKLLYSVPML
jgi:hypothetical protein